MAKKVVSKLKNIYRNMEESEKAFIFAVSKKGIQYNTSTLPGDSGKTELENGERYGIFLTDIQKNGEESRTKIRKRRKKWYHF